MPSWVSGGKCAAIIVLSSMIKVILRLVKRVFLEANTGECCFVSLYLDFNAPFSLLDNVVCIAGPQSGRCIRKCDSYSKGKRDDQKRGTSFSCSIWPHFSHSYFY